MDKCPKCGNVLNNDEKACGKCFSCDATFDSNLPKDNQNPYYSKNTVSSIIKYIGITIIVLGTIYSFVIANDREYRYHFNLLLFVVPEFISIISGILFIGFSEVIQLLDDIKNKLKW